jgi:hypothetical protein
MDWLVANLAVEIVQAQARGCSDMLELRQFLHD